METVISSSLMCYAFMYGALTGFFATLMLLLAMGHAIGGKHGHGNVPKGT